MFWEIFYLSFTYRCVPFYQVLIVNNGAQVQNKEKLFIATYYRQFTADIEMKFYKNKTMGDKLIYIPNYDKQEFHLCFIDLKIGN